MSLSFWQQVSRKAREDEVSRRFYSTSNERQIMKGIKLEYGATMHRGIIYVMRQVSGTWVPLRLEKQHTYREWLGCFSAI